ncbi:hypothetical protein J3T65_02910 [Staphylococcus simiae]|uniref:hypothetical protein n=1 Tax=Staphylococcus simiae TaxID=308354 RepID=UPI001A95A14C|nr:hypothetical protein [Staphylococcus simiae]MBO1198416.1 hypothetical protein [Staphylococcus simiae]MBO1200610.1 hypothetical protein [Staphylococcus simiae]MBO1202881.1 hypothetical protein [Staphylococcus simiae]MBO1210407.1 hypothetical protein [Staphylococcus simiae]MBO1228947.1 hypothetical protein [Staphylococcus simiae]
MKKIFLSIGGILIISLLSLFIIYEWKIYQELHNDKVTSSSDKHSSENKKTSNNDKDEKPTQTNTSTQNMDTTNAGDNVTSNQNNTTNEVTPEPRPDDNEVIKGNPLHNEDVGKTKGQIREELMANTDINNLPAGTSLQQYVDDVMSQSGGGATEERYK